MKQEKQEEEPIVYEVELLEDLIQRQQRLLKLSDEIIDSKNQLIDLYELETEIYKKQIKRLKKSLIICGVVLILNVIIYIVSLAH
jgi:uncharacterized protein YlxW (UPF0749 family)